MPAMPALNHVIAFDRPLHAVQLTHGAKRMHTPAELNEAHARGFHEGEKSAQAFSDRQMVELRSDVENLQRGLLAELAAANSALEAQVRSALPMLTLELGKRLLAGYEPTPEQVETVCREALDQLYPERSDLELVVSPADAGVLAKITTNWATHFPGLKITPDDTLGPGDCLVKSRFGVTDARGHVKLDALRHELISA